MMQSRLVCVSSSGIFPLGNNDFICFYNSTIPRLIVKLLCILLSVSMLYCTHSS